MSASAKLALLVTLLAASASHANDQAKKLPTTLDLAIPDSPAATIIGAGDGTALKPSTAREFAASLLNIVDRKGKVAPGVAFEVSPALLIYGPLQMRGYKDSRYIRALASLQLSLATANKNEATGKAQDIGIGARISLIDDGDPRTSEFLNFCFKQIPPPSVDDLAAPDELAETEALPASVKAFLKKCYANERARAWNAQALTLAFAQAYKDTGTSDSDLKRAGKSVWINYGMPIGGTQRVNVTLIPATKNAEGKITKEAVTKSIDVSPGQLILQGKLGWDAIESGTTPIAERTFDSRSVAGKLRWGSDSANVLLGASNEKRKFESGTRSTSRIISAGFELKVQKDLWLRFDAGREDKSSTGAKPFGNLVLTWAKASEQALDPRPALP